MKVKVKITDLTRLREGKYQVKVNIKAGGYDFDKVFIYTATEKVTMEVFKDRLAKEIKKEVKFRDNAAELRKMENKVFNLDI